MIAAPPLLAGSGTTSNSSAALAEVPGAASSGGGGGGGGLVSSVQVPVFTVGGNSFGLLGSSSSRAFWTYSSWHDLPRSVRTTSRTSTSLASMANGHPSWLYAAVLTKYPSEFRIPGTVACCALPRSLGLLAPYTVKLPHLPATYCIFHVKAMGRFSAEEAVAL